MESTQREILAVLLGRVFELGLISKFTYQRAEDLARSAPELPAFFKSPVCRTEGEDLCGGTQNTG